jgi:hypothetical protein
MIKIRKITDHEDPKSFPFDEAVYTCYNCGFDIFLKGGTITSPMCPICHENISVLADIVEDGIQGVLDYYLVGWPAHDKEMLDSINKNKED